MVAVTQLAAFLFGVGFCVFGCFAIEKGTNPDGVVVWPLMLPFLYLSLGCLFASAALAALAEIQATTGAVLKRLTPPKCENPTLARPPASSTAESGPLGK